MEKAERFLAPLFLFLRAKLRFLRLGLRLPVVRHWAVPLARNYVKESSTTTI